MIVSPPRETYPQSWLLRGVIAVLALIVAFPMYRSGSVEGKPALEYGAAAVVLVAIVGWILLSKIVLTIHEEGVRRETAFGVKEIEWTNVKEYRYAASNQKAMTAMHVGGLIGLLLYKMANRNSGGESETTSLRLVSKDGTVILVSGMFKDFKSAVATILTRVHTQLRPQVQSEISATGATFGPLRLSARDLQWKAKDPVPLRELESAQLAGSALVVKQTGKMFKLVSVGCNRVPNVLLFLEEIERLGVAGVRQDSLASIFQRQ